MAAQPHLCRGLSALLAGLVLLLVVAPAQAILYTFHADSSNGPMTLSLQFSDSPSDQNVSPFLGQYDDSAVSLLLETSSFTMTRVGTFDVAETNVLNPNAEFFQVTQSTGLVIDPPGAANPLVSLVIGGPNFLGGSDALPLTLPSTVPQGGFGAIAYEDMDGNLFYGTIRLIEVTPTPPPVPEPATAALALLGLGGLLAMSMRRRSV